MSLFQCEHCGCCENTALASQGHSGYMTKFFNWKDIEHLKGKKLCSACGPTHYSDGRPNNEAGWHGHFKRVYLPLGMFRTNERGDLAHRQTGDTDINKHAITAMPQSTHANTDRSEVSA